MRKKLISVIFFTCIVAFFASADELILYGYIREAIFKTGLPNAWVWTIGADGERVDSLPIGKIKNSVYSSDVSGFGLVTDTRDSVYVFEVGCEGFQTQVVTYKVENAKRKWRIDMPEIYLERAPHKLNELTVTTSKVKFYLRGDTLVYNADAFQLAEGSMLDGLIKQLPGTELKSNGQITVNGEFVESLLLDGKPFFDGNNNLMLKNLGAYMVKNVEVYKGYTEAERLENTQEPPTHLTMNVRLKKEYNVGWVANVQAGYGSEDRYMGRVFGVWFKPRSRVGILANVNNLNDNHMPGESDGWTPEQMPIGIGRNVMAGITYNHSKSDNNASIAGNLYYDSGSLDIKQNLDRTNFFQTGNVYDYARSAEMKKSVRISTSHQGDIRIAKVLLKEIFKGNYDRNDGETSSVSASFNREQGEMSLKMLETLYDVPTTEQLRSLINHSAIIGTGVTKKGNIDSETSVRYSIPNTSDFILFKGMVKYASEKRHQWDDYKIRYGQDAATVVMPLGSHRRNFTDDSPNHTLGLGGLIRYLKRVKGINIGISYCYDYCGNTKDSYMYALDQLADMGVFGSLPADYRVSMDAGNSYMSTQRDNIHSGLVSANYHKMLANGIRISVSGAFDIGIQHSRLNYMSNGVLYPVKRTSIVVGGQNTKIELDFNMNRSAEGGANTAVRYGYNLECKLPDMLHMVDVVRTADPLNINLGNPNLKNSYHNKHWLEYRVVKGERYNVLTLSATHTTNALLRGFIYDMETGVRYNRTYNVRGNYSLGASDGYYLQFGRRKQFTLQSTTSAGLIHSVEMIGEISGEDSIDPAPSKVNNRNISESLKLSWQIGRQTLSAIGKVTDTRTTRQHYADINATHWNYGLQGQFALPAGFGISTDFTCYTRRGYGVKELDTPDAVWNARITYTPRGGHWVIAVDGFDLLHQLSNVNYAVTATGRTVTVTNTLPRYILASVQYRFNITPKHR